MGRMTKVSDMKFGDVFVVEHWEHLPFLYLGDRYYIYEREPHYGLKHFDKENDDVQYRVIKQYKPHFVSDNLGLPTQG
jgi:hypothetical protein